METGDRKQKRSEADGKPDAEKLIAAHLPRLKAFIRRRVPSREDADDLLQDVFYQLLRAIDDPLHPIERVEAWLYRVARNAIVNLGKKKREESMPVCHDGESGETMISEFSEILFSDGDAPSPETEYLRSLVWTELEQALSELPPEQREIFELTELDGLPVKEIARTTGTGVNTLLSRKHYAVLHLRKRMKDLYAELTDL
ncbi:MAG: sigma-70 family RNA polymerase sigma factor [Tannerella sp.]|jgi:RNA polymerase sigma factor (sigma-70 family)|nr:sigma-70 family RNA polymerase sigma factor [Tannerella sp.]